MKETERTKGEQSDAQRSNKNPRTAGSKSDPKWHAEEQTQKKTKSSPSTKR